MSITVLPASGPDLAASAPAHPSPLREQIRCVLVSASALAARRIGQACDTVFGPFRGEVAFSSHFFDFNDPQAGGNALRSLREASEADIVVFACESVLPEAVKDWIRHWAVCRSRPQGALVGLANGLRPDIAPAMHCFLEDIARQTGMDYLPYNIRFDVPAIVPFEPAEAPRQSGHNE